MSLLNDDKLNEILHNLKAGTGPTDEDMAAIHEAFVGVGKVFGELQLRMEAVSEAYLDIWEVIATRLPPDLLELVHQAKEEDSHASR